MATSKELLKAQKNGATIEFVRGSVRTRRVVEYAPRGKGDQTPWVERVGEAIWRYSARHCVAFFPEPKVIQTPAAPVVEIRIPAEPKLIDIPFPAVTPAGQQTVEEIRTLINNAETAMAGVARVRELKEITRREYPGATEFETYREELNGPLLGYTFRSGRRYGWITVAGRRCNALEDYRSTAASMLPYAVADENQGN